MLPWFLYVVAKVVLALMLVPLLFFEINKQTCNYLTIGSLIVAVIGFLADAPLSQNVCYLILSFVFGLAAYIIWWPSKGLLVVLVQLWRRGRMSDA